MRWWLGFIAVVLGLTTLTVVGVGFYLSPQDALEAADAVVVISGGETDLRMKEGIRLYQAGWAPLMVVSGAARDEGISNAAAMKQIAVSAGIPSEKVLVEEQAQTTIDNAKYIKELIAEHSVDSIILITSPYHQRRASMNFRHFLGEDFKIINHSSRDSAWRKNGWWKGEWSRALTISELQKILYLQLFFPRPA